eukprot:1681097-Rhodomonas_salina.1
MLRGGGVCRMGLVCERERGAGSGSGGGHGERSPARQRALLERLPLHPSPPTSPLPAHTGQATRDRERTVRRGA